MSGQGYLQPIHRQFLISKSTLFIIATQAYEGILQVCRDYPCLLTHHKRRLPENSKNSLICLNKLDYRQENGLGAKGWWVVKSGKWFQSHRTGPAGNRGVFAGVDEVVRVSKKARYMYAPTPYLHHRIKKLRHQGLSKHYLNKEKTMYLYCFSADYGLQRQSKNSIGNYSKDDSCLLIKNHIERQIGLFVPLPFDVKIHSPRSSRTLQNAVYTD